MGLLSFTTWQFAAAGAACAAAPLIIHLLNRRRFRVVQWAAMDFLRQALQKNRRILQMRDLLLLLLRTLAVLLFGLGLARPYWASRTEQLDDRQPLHAIVVLDNSLSMAYESLEGSLLDQAKRQARDLVDRLPAGSRVSIIPACGSRSAVSIDPLESKDAAAEALARIEIVDRTASLGRVAHEVRRAIDDAPELTKRVIFFSDQQALNWQGNRPSDVWQGLPPLQVVAVRSAEWTNTWIAGMRVQDGLADVETPATVIVEVAHRGSGARRDLEVTLSLGETVLGQKTISVEPGLGTREVSFECSFGGLSELPEPDRPVFLPLKAALPRDRLPADDERFLAVPLVAALPVVFIDQYGPEQEDIARGRLGETRHLRKLLAPRTSRGEAPRQLISVRHLATAAVSRDALADARLVVIAGLRDPGPMTPLLADYVRQGGRLLIAAGVDFDPEAWNAAAWLEGNGILPLPLAREPIGQTPEEASGNLKPFFLSFESLAGNDYFQLAGVAENDLKELFGEPFFFKAVRVDRSPPTIAAWRAAEMQRQQAIHEDAATSALPIDASETKPADWLIWATADTAERAPDSSAEAASGTANREQELLARSPQILASYEFPDRPAFLVSRKMGRGEVVFCSTGVLSPWNTLPKTNAMLIFDRILRGLIESTLPRRNIGPTDRMTLPLPHDAHNWQVTLRRPGDQAPAEPLDISFISPAQRGVTLTGLLERGEYRVAGYRAIAGELAGDALAIDKPAWSVPLVVGGSSEESDLASLSRAQFQELAPTGELAWVAPGEEISMAGAAIRGHNSWWWLVMAVLVLLVLEMTVVIWPLRGTSVSPAL